MAGFALTLEAQISNSRRIFRSTAPPEDPHTLRRFNSLVVSSRSKNLLFQGALTRACWFRAVQEKE